MATVPLAGGDTGRGGGRGIADWQQSVLGGVLLIGAWQLLGATLLSDTLPGPWAIVEALVEDWSLYPANIQTTMTAAAKGWLVGNLVAVALAVVVVALPFTERSILRLAVATYSLPIIAVGPILQVTLSGDAPRAALAGLAVFFTTLIGAVLGLRSAEQRSLDVIRALGGSPMMAIRKVRLRAALPSFFAGLKISAPAAVLGAVIGEYMGSNSGLGVFMVSAASNLNQERLWGIALVATALAGIGYALIALVGRLLTPWAPKAAQR